jgi:hypothetical protein
MEGIETADAILSKVFPKSDFEKKDREREERVKIDIKKLKMDHLEKLLVPVSPVSLMIDDTRKI